MSIGASVLYGATGLVWTGRSILEVVVHPNYWDPVTPVDWVAVLGYSLAFVLLAATLVVLTADRRLGVVARGLGWLAAAVAAIAGAANALEDAVGLELASTVFVVGALGTVIAMVALAVSLGVARRWAVMIAVLLMAVGVVAMTEGLGVLVLAGAVVAMLAPRFPRSTSGVAVAD